MRNLLIVLVLILTGATFYSALWFKSVSIENDITARVTEDLGPEGDDIDIDVDGRHVTLTGVVYDEATEQSFLTTADETYGALGPVDGLTLQRDAGYLNAVKTDAGITLRGTVPTEAARLDLIASAAAATDGDVSDELIVSGPEGAWQDEAAFGVRQLAGLTAGTLTASAGAYTLSGTAPEGTSDADAAVSDREGWSSFVSTPVTVPDLSGEVAQLSADVADRDGLIAELQSSLANGETTISSLQASVTDKDSMITGLTEERDAITTELADLRASLSEGDASAESLRTQLSAAQSDLGDAQTMIGQKDEVIAGLEADLAAGTELQATASGDLQSQRRRADDAEALVTSLTADLAAKDAELQTLQGEVAERQNILESSDDQLSNLLASLTRAETSIEGLNGDVADRDATIASLQTEASTAEEANAAEVASLGDTIDGLTATVAQREGTLVERDELIAKLNEDLAARDTLVASTEAGKAEAEADAGRLTGIIAQRDATIAELRNQDGSATIAQQCAAQATNALEGSRINFVTASAEIEGSSVPLLERLTGIALACIGDGLSVEVGGHTDSQGTDENNQALSEARAQSVVAFMAERGVPTTGLRAVGYGEGQPIASNDTAEGRAVNRRISFDWQSR